MFATVNGIRLFYDVLNPKLALTAAGADELPTLVCIHGGPGGDHMSLRPEIDLLCPSAHVVLFDQRGGGRSDAGPPQQWTLDQWADDVAGFCDALGIVKPIVFGNSGGGMVALRYAARHPNHAGAFVLVSTAPRIVPADRIADFERRGGPAAGAAARGLFERCAGRLWSHAPLPAHACVAALSDGAARARAAVSAST
jgi:proline iminopeptidase